MIKIGTSGFSFPDWKGTVYPKKTKPSEMLPYYEHELGFNVCELNYTYYRLPDAYTMEKMALKVSDGFEFTVKAFREMTHEIWEDEKREKFKDNRKVFRDFAKGVAPLAQNGKLGAVLLQFPTFFKRTRQNIEYLERTKELLTPLPLVIEFRNREWLNDEVRDLLKEEELGLCVVDEPQLPRLLPYEPDATSDIGYFRFHGRNPQWYSAGAHERYNYLYTQTELEGFLPGIKKVAKKTKKTYLFFNNCFMGQSAKNAAQIREMLGIKFHKRTPKLF
ncbi:MAG TPA: DUF72 domain-containing protein [Candidatus Omnitrophota bacterium]|nr:DUF72 domain-containing protein [Candidatus Omnitrophota bacterium]